MSHFSHVCIASPSNPAMILLHAPNRNLRGFIAHAAISISLLGKVYEHHLSPTF